MLFHVFFLDNSSYIDTLGEMCVFVGFFGGDGKVSFSTSKK